MLHEFGHAFGIPGFQDDYGNSQVSWQNNDMVSTNPENTIRDAAN
jgi:predicted Zn-dependent protease